MKNQKTEKTLYFCVDNFGLTLLPSTLKFKTILIFDYIKTLNLNIN